MRVARLNPNTNAGAYLHIEFAHSLHNNAPYLLHHALATRSVDLYV